MIANPPEPGSGARPSPRWGWAAALGAALGMLLTTLLLVYGLQELQRTHVGAELDIELKRAEEKVEAQLEERIRVLARMAHRWARRGPPLREDWEDDAALYLRDFQSFQAVAWADESHHVRWVFPLQGNEAVVGMDLASEPRRREAVLKAQASGAVVVSRTVELVQHGRGFLVMAPIVREGQFLGTIIGVFRVQDTLETILGQDFQSRFGMSVFDGDELIYHRELLGAPADAEWTREGTLRFRDVVWRLRLQPAPELMDPLWLALPELVLVVGVLLSGLAFAAVWLASQARSRAQELEGLSAFQRAILNGTNFAIISTHLDGIIRVFNKGAEKMLGYSAEEVVGKVTPLVFHDPQELEDRARQLSRELGRPVAPNFEALSPRLFEEGVAEGEWHYLRKDGSRVPVQLSLSALRNAQGQVTQFAGIALDVTVRKQAERALVQAKEAAEEATRVKSDFLARMSHELRTPLNGVVGMLELALGTQLSPPQRDYLETAQDSARSLSRIIHDILLFSKGEAGKMLLEQLPFRLRELLRLTLKPLEPMAREMGLGLRIAIPDAVPDTLMGDPYRLRQVLLNLLENALKFTERGEVVMAVEREESPEGFVRLRFSVADTGIGIPEAQRHRVFEAFVQADEATTRKYGGTGLGLAISSQLVSLMGGRLQVESQEGQGSRFHFSVEFALASEVPAPEVLVASVLPDSRLAQQPREVLVVEDNKTNQRVVTGLLERAGHRVTSVDNGQVAIEALRVRRYDVVLMDVQMPGMDGLEATRVIRSEEAHRGERVTIIALTAQSLEGDEQRCLEAGMDGYLSKPVQAGALLKAIDELPRPSEASPPASTPEEPPVDQEYLLSRLDGDVHLMKEVAGLFLSECSELRVAIEQALERGDARELAHFAHRVKGALLNLSANPAAAAARKLEELGREKRLSEARPALDDLKRELDRLCGVLEKLRATV
ncbi:ATP-binding protein [Hyalangium versicolor]|uniref:ATP-binding protein n=1 Tax=Hyalangium versicolor TaxID=2861190 RepID=UPI001CCC5A2A|nr:ATP-binding protein [Hyalangium versicolor]